MGKAAEYGFWDYTAPATGGMEHYERDDLAIEVAAFKLTKG